MKVSDTGWGLELSVTVTHTTALGRTINDRVTEYKRPLMGANMKGHQETWHSNNRTNRDGIVMSSDYSGLTRLTDYSVAIV
jgi:hypothetical protein